MIDADMLQGIGAGLAVAAFLVSQYGTLFIVHIAAAGIVMLNFGIYVDRFHPSISQADNSEVSE